MVVGAEQDMTVHIQKDPQRAGIPAEGGNSRAGSRPAETVRGIQQRVAMFDAVRVVAALAVIYFHSVESETLRASGTLGRFSVAFYTMTAMIFLVQGILRHPERTWWDYANSRFKRLYLPFVGWSLIMGVGMTVMHAWDERVAVPELGVNTLVSGMALPLWFIPFVLVGGIMLFPVAKLTVGNKRRERCLMVGAVLVGIILDWVPWHEPPWQQVPLVGKFLELSWHRWSALYWGLGLAIAYFRWIKNSRYSSLLAWAGLGLLIFVVAHQWRYGVVPGLKVMGGVGACLVAFAPWHNQLISRVGQLAPYAFGIYMSHTLWITVGQLMMRRLHWSVCWQTDILVFLFAGVCSLVVIRMLAKVPSLAWLAGCEQVGAQTNRIPQPVTVPI